MTDARDSHKYDDIIHLPHHISAKHPQMSRHDRAAQFSPFSALNGYQSVLSETSRLTDRRIELSEDERAALDERLRLVVDTIPDGLVISFTYFVPDTKKDGGAYVTAAGTVKKIDEFEKTITLTDGICIPIGEILSIEGRLFTDLE